MDRNSMEMTLHDIKNGIQNIHGYLQVLRIKLKDEDYEKSLSLVDGALNSINALNESIFDIMSNSKFNLYEALNEAIENVSGRAACEHININMDFIIDRDIMIYHSKHDFVRAFTNIINNSIDAIVKKNLLLSPEVIMKNDIFIKVTMIKGGFISIAFMDTGVGFHGPKSEESVCKDYSKKNNFGIGLKSVEHLEKYGCFYTFNFGSNPKNLYSTQMTLSIPLK